MNKEKYTVNQLNVFIVPIDSDCDGQNTPFEVYSKLSGVEILSLPEFFQSCNDERIDLENNWTFLVDHKGNELNGYYL